MARALGAAAGLLGVEEGELRTQLTERLISVGSDDVTIPLAPEAARAARDACCKAVYQRLFAFYVHCLNVLLRPSAAGASAPSEDARGRSVGLLDVFVCCADGNPRESASPAPLCPCWMVVQPHRAHG